MDKETRIKIVKLYYELKSVISVRRTLQKDRNSRTPTYNEIRGVIKSFETRGTVERKKPNRKKSVRVSENIGAVARAIQEKATTSTRKLSSAIGITRRSLQRILKVDLNLFPYKIQIVSKIMPGDYYVRETFCQKMLELMDNDSTLIDHLFMSDEAHFDLNGNVNKQNCRIWAESNPKAVHEVKLHPQRVTVWCAVSSKCIIGPFFFECAGKTTTVNSKRYLDMIKSFFMPNLRRKRFLVKDTWFQQDGATPHIACEVMQHLTKTFTSKLISRNAAFRWPPRSPDLTAADFYLWGYLKSIVYRNNPQNLTDLKREIECGIKSISQDTLKAVMNEFVRRCRDCVANKGKHLDSVIFK